MPIIVKITVRVKLKVRIFHDFLGFDMYLFFLNVYQEVENQKKKKRSFVIKISFRRIDYQGSGLPLIFLGLFQIRESSGKCWELRIWKWLYNLRSDEGVGLTLGNFRKAETVSGFGHSIHPIVFQEGWYGWRPDDTKVTKNSQRGWIVPCE